MAVWMLRRYVRGDGFGDVHVVHPGAFPSLAQASGKVQTPKTETVCMACTLSWQGFETGNAPRCCLLLCVAGLFVVEATQAIHPHANGLGRLGMGWGLSSQRSRWCMNNLHTVHAASIHLYTTTSFIAPTHPPTHPPHTDLDHAPTEPGACHRCLGRGSPRCLHGRGGALISISSSSSLYLPRGSNYGLFPCSSCAARMSLLLPARGIAAQRA